MNKPTRLPGVDPSFMLNKIIDDAYGRTKRKGGTLAEPEFVHELISRQTIRSLNHASTVLYDANKNSVRFFSGFIHNNPLAQFDADDHSGNKKPGCSVELGDMLLVRVLTEQDATGRHVEVERRALLIQAKKSKAKVPSLLKSFSGRNKGFLDINDREQLFLYHYWPEFTLKVGKKSLGTFNLSAATDPTFPIGKYAAVLDPTSTNSFKSGTTWNSLNPVPGNRDSISLGQLLTQFVDGDSGAGLKFSETVGSTTPADGWDGMLGALTKYCTTNTYASSSRLRDPHGLSFSTLVADLLPASATILQNFPYIHGSAGADSFDIYSLLELALLPHVTQTPETESLRGMPVLIVGVSSFLPPKECREPVSLRLRRKSWHDALNTVDLL